jgi:hypothetical protein
LESANAVSNKTTHEIEAIGSIRAANGTALETIAGAAAHWEQRAKRAESVNEEAAKRRWRDGFLTGSVSIAVIVSVAAILLHFFS